MLGSQHPDKSAVGRKRTDSASASITEKSNLQLLNEVEAMLSLPAEEMDTDRIEEYLSLLQKKAPVTEHYDPEEKWAKLEESHPLIFEEEPNSCKSDLAAEARNRHGNRTRRSFSRVFRAAAITLSDQICSNNVQRTYTVEQVSRILGISLRKTYYLCEHTTDFKVIRLGKRCLRIHKESFDSWFNALDQP